MPSNIRRHFRVCLSFNKKLRCRLKKPSARRKTQLIAGLFTSFTTTTMAFLGTTRRGGLLFCPIKAKNKLRRSLLLKDKQTLISLQLISVINAFQQIFAIFSCHTTKSNIDNLECIMIHCRIIKIFMVMTMIKLFYAHGIS